MLLTKINIPFYTVLYFCLSLIFGTFGSVFIFIFCSFIHELFHCIMANIFEIKTICIKITPIGCNAIFEDFDKLNLYKKILIYLIGPFSIIIIVPFFYFLKQLDFIQNNQFIMLINVNILIFIFNLLPLSILDGGHIIDHILYHKFDIIKAGKIILFYNILCSIFIMIFLFLLKQYLLIILLLFYVFSLVISYKKRRKNLFYKRLILCKKDLPIRINDRKIIYKDYENYYIENGNLINEDLYIKDIF